MIEKVKYLLLPVAAFLLLQFVSDLESSATQGDQLSVMTYNIRYDNPDDGIHNWHMRKERMQQFLNSERPGIFGIQEGLYHQVQFLDSALVNYNYIGVGRDDGKMKGEYSAIFYDTTRLSVEQSGTFWLSPTPNKPSKGWDAALPRICTYGTFIYQEKQIAVYNTHFDHRGNNAREESAKLIVQKIKELEQPATPIVLMGDFNLTPESRGIQWIANHMEDYGDQLNPIPKGTSCGFVRDGAPERRIDYIFTKNLSVSTYKHLNPLRPGGHHLSDHLPVITVVQL